MKNYKIILFIFLILFTGMSCVDAMDINNMDNVTIDNDSVSVVGMDDSSGTFSNLQNEIDICENNDFKLTKNYEYSSTEKPYDGISIFKDNFTVDGQGHTIKGNGKSKMFDIRANNVTIKNINFINGYSEFYGGAIFFDGSGLIENCTFKNNIAQLGGAIFIRENVTVKNSIFMNNIAESGGAINFLNNGIIENCSFKNNTDSIHDANDQYNGAIFCEKGKEYIIIKNCYFDSIKEPSQFEYSILIPNYVNVTNIWRITSSGWLKKEYIASQGAGGKVKMPVNREYIILTGGDSYTYSSNDLKSKNIQLNIDELSNLTISSNSDYTKFTYSSFIHENVNQISAVFRQKEVNGMLYHDYEELLIVFNSAVKLSIGFSNPVGWDETGVRMAFSDNNYGHVNDMMWCRYDKFNHYDLLTFAETGEIVEYNSDMLKISNFPTKEKITTQFKMNTTSIIKDEWISFGKHYDKENSFEVVQSYAVADKPVNKQILDYWLEMNQGYPIGAMKASYGTFLTALNTIKMYDEYLMNISDLYDVIPIRESFAVSMCGVEYGGTAYVHTPDPTLNYKLYGEDKNVYICRYFSSLFLGEFESYSLNCAGIPSISSMNYVFTNIFNRNFTVSSKEDYTIIQIDDVPEHQIKLNLSSGLVYDLTIKDDFIYKGAISCDPYNFCFHDFLTDNLIKNISKNRNSEGIELSDKDIELLEDTLAELALSLAVASIPALMAGPISIPILLAVVGLVVGGYLLKTHLRNWDFKAGFGDTLISLVHCRMLS